jgi:hypothetical protein
MGVFQQPGRVSKNGGVREGGENRKLDAGGVMRVMNVTSEKRKNGIEPRRSKEEQGNEKSTDDIDDTRIWFLGDPLGCGTLDHWSGIPATA